MEKNETFNGHNLPVVTLSINRMLDLYSEEPLITPGDAVKLVSDHIYNSAKEFSCVICLDTGLAPICVGILGVGTHNDAPMNARDVVQYGIISNASYLILVHNHPSNRKNGDGLKPSPADISNTDLISKACNLMNMQLFDSIIINTMNTEKGKSVPAYYSMRTHKHGQVAKIVKKNFEEFVNHKANEADIDWINKNKTIEKMFGFDPSEKSRENVSVAYNEKQFEYYARKLRSPEGGIALTSREENKLRKIATDQWFEDSLKTTPTFANKISRAEYEELCIANAIKERRAKQEEIDKEYEELPPL